MSLKVSKGQKITAEHQNKIINAICSLGEKKPTNKGLDFNQSEPEIQVPVFNLCWYQTNDAGIVAYFNTQNKENAIVYYNNVQIPYNCFGYTLPESEAAYPASEIISCDSNPTVYYKAFKNIDTTCGVTEDIYLRVIKKREEEKDSACTEIPEEEEEKELSSYMAYTFAKDEDILAEWTTGFDELNKFLIGSYENYNIKQVHDGLLIDSVGIKTTDALIPELKLSSINIEEYLDEETNKKEKYLTLLNFCQSFDKCIEERDIYKQQNDCYKVLLSKKDNDELTLAYGEPDRHFILNDLGAIEPADFIVPRNVSSVQNIVVGLGLEITPPEGTEGSEGTETEGTESEKEVATICFTNPYREEDIDNSTGCGSCGETTVKTGLLSNDWVFSLDKDDKSGIFKRYKPISICENLENDYLSVTFMDNINEYQIRGPKMTFERVSPPKAEEGSEGVEGGDAGGEESEGEIKEGFFYKLPDNEWKLTLFKTDLSAGCYIQIEEDQKTKIPVINGPNMVYKELDVCSESTTGFNYDCASHTWTLSVMPHSKAGAHLKQDFNIINGPSIEFGEVGPDATTNANYSSEDNKWTLDIKTLEGSGISAGTFIKLDEQKDKPTVINGPNITLVPIDACAENQTNRIEYKDDSHTWEVHLKLNQLALEAGCYIQIVDGKINGPNIKVEKGCELTATYNPHEWTITVPENTSNLSAGEYITITDNKINGAKIVFKQHGCDGNPTTNGTATHDPTTNTWTLDVNAEGTLEQGDYIQIVDGKINGAAIEVTKGDKLTATYSPYKWTITVPENVSNLSAGQYTTITNNQINGANIVIDNSCGKIAGTATHDKTSNTWTISLPKSGEADFDGVKSLNGLKDEVTIASNTLNVTQSGQNINIEFPDEGVQYDFDEEWFIVTGNKVTINECAVAAVAQNVIPTIEASITPTVTMAIDEVSDAKRSRCGDIMATVTNSSAFNATARFRTSWRS
jgi:hypothetical protein